MKCRERDLSNTFQQELARRKSIFSCWSIQNSKDPSHLVETTWLKRWAGFGFFGETEKLASSSTAEKPQAGHNEDVVVVEWQPENGEVNPETKEPTEGEAQKEPEKEGTPGGGGESEKTPAETDGQKKSQADANHKPPEAEAEGDKKQEKEAPAKVVACPHGKLHPDLVQFTKRITLAAHEMMVQDDPYYRDYAPKFTTDDICVQCFEQEVKGTLSLSLSPLHSFFLICFFCFVFLL